MSEPNKKKQKSSIFKPDASNEDKNYWKTMYYRANANRKEAWRKYYESDKTHWSMLVTAKTTIKCPEIPKHIKDEYIKFIEKFDEEKRECPICSEPMSVENAELTDCGHLFHTSCLGLIETCPMCRRKRNKKE